MTLLERLGAGRPSPGASYTPSASSAAPPPLPARGGRRGGAGRIPAGAGPLPVRDGAGNRMADVPPAPGRASAPRLILQGHLDMVCAVRPGSGWNPLTDPVTVVEEGASSARTAAPPWGRTTTWATRRRCGSCPTGAVNHGPLRLLFTTAEEVGLEGARRWRPTGWPGRNTCSTPTAFTWAGRWWARPADGGRPGPPRWTPGRPRRSPPGGSPSPAAGAATPATTSTGARPTRSSCWPAYLAGLPGGRIASLSGGLTHNAIPPRPRRWYSAPRARPLPPAGRPGRLPGGRSRPDRGLRPGGGAGAGVDASLQAHALAF